MHSSRMAWLRVFALSTFAGVSGPTQPVLAEFTSDLVRSFELPERGLGALVLGSDGALYGTTLWGGSDDAGTVFRIASDGKLPAPAGSPCSL